MAQVTHVDRTPVVAPLQSVTLKLTQNEAQLIRDLVGSAVPEGEIEKPVWALFDALRSIPELSNTRYRFDSIKQKV